MRVLDERDDIAYAKLFCGKSGFITRAWIPCFLAVRRPLSFDEAYESGLISHDALRIMRLIDDHTCLSVDELKTLGGFAREDKARFDRALVSLQMRMDLTMCGRKRKISRAGVAYGWNSTVFIQTENFWDPAVLDEANALSQDEAFAKIKAQILRLNPAAEDKRIARFIAG